MEGISSKSQDMLVSMGKAAEIHASEGAPQLMLTILINSIS